MQYNALIAFLHQVCRVN